MWQTIRAILARFDGDYDAARKYCEEISYQTENPALRTEYASLARYFNHEVQCAFKVAAGGGQCLK